MLTINQLRVAYHKQIVLDELTLSLQPHLIHGIVGLNGAGKSTLFRTLFGLISPKKGTLSFGKNALSRKDIAFLPTENYFYSNITGREYLSLFPKNNSSFLLSAWEELFKLPLDKMIDGYSTGMRKKLALVGILKLDKPILLLDEPFNGVDLETVIIIKMLLQKLRQQQKTILISSHILESLSSICDYIHYLANKHIQKTYEISELEAIHSEIFRDMNQSIQTLLDEAI